MIERKRLPTDTDKEASKRLKQLIKGHPEKKQYDIANDLGVTAGYISHLANGIRIIDVGTLLDLSESLGVLPSAIYPELANSISEKLTGGSSSLLTEYVELFLSMPEEKRETTIKIMKVL
ncbi:XRE family transcriptional regulator [Leucothrix sargassi]|nr:XRE family transcriptional regulator [Leucothrix sargassi]